MFQLLMILILTTLSAPVSAQTQKTPACLRDEHLATSDQRINQALQSAQGRICNAAGEKASKTVRLTDTTPFALLETAHYYYDCRKQKVVLGTTVRSGFGAFDTSSKAAINTSVWFDDGEKSWSDSGQVLMIPSEMYAKPTVCHVEEHERLRKIIIHPPQGWNELRGLERQFENEDPRAIGLVCRNNYEHRQVECQWTDDAAWKLRVDYSRKDSRFDSLFCKFVSSSGCEKDKSHFAGTLVKPAPGWRSWIGARDHYPVECE